MKIQEVEPELKSTVSFTVVKGKDTIVGLDYVDTGDTCTVTITGRVTSTSDYDDTVSISIEPSSIKFKKPRVEDEEDEVYRKSLKEEMNSMTSQRRWRPGSE